MGKAQYEHEQEALVARCQAPEQMRHRQEPELGKRILLHFNQTRPGWKYESDQCAGSKDPFVAVD